MRHDINPSDWSGNPGRRVLIEAGDWAKRESLARLLQRDDYQTATCDGPESNNGRCVLVASGECNICRDADVVVHALRHSDPRNREVLMNLQSRYPDKPLIVEVPGPRAEKYPTDFAGCMVIAQPMMAESLLEAISEALASVASES